MEFDVVVVGAGINGLCAAEQLLRRGVDRLAVLEQFTPGHGRGSSHGFSRITRSTYHASRYIELVQEAHAVEWPRLSAEAGCPLLHPLSGCFFGPGVGAYKASLQAVPEVRDRVEVLAHAEARRAFPHFLFPDCPEVLKDNTCALVAARQTIEHLLARVGDRLLAECRLERLERTSAALVLHTSRGTMRCQRLILAGGPWTERLVPELAPRLRVAHQDVAYFQFDGHPQAPGDFPVWVYVGETADDNFYGLPEFGRPGVKVARHRTGPHGDDPDRVLPEDLPEAARRDLVDFVGRHFAWPVERVGYEACLYTNTPDEDFVLDHLPGEPRVVVAAGFSGHGFKFGPVTGRILAELLLDGKTGVDAFERHKAHFALAGKPEWPCPA